MANQEHLDILKQGVQVWNAWRLDHPNVIPDLGRGNLNGANLMRVDLNRVDLTRADIYHANLREAVRLLTAESVTHKESCLNSDMRIERPASRSGTSWDVKPADN